MDSKSYLTLNSWLQKADNNYIEGRLLWLNLCIDGSSNLLWLASEQILKILLLQKKIDDLSEGVSSLDELHGILKREGIALGHNVCTLVNNINSEYPSLNISRFKPTLIKLNKYFYRRYVVNTSSTISILMLDEVDEFYFLSRSKILPDVGLGTIDEIYIQRKHNWAHPLPAFRYAYFLNKYFKSRKHREINQQGPDGKIYKENGT